MNDDYIGERYGIWGVDPYGPTIKQTPVLTTAMQTGLQTAQGVGNLFAQRYANQLASAKAQLAQGTLGSSIDAANTKNQADIQNYPLQQMFKTQQDEQTVKEIMARTGLSYAQAQQALAGAGAENARAGLLNAQTQEVTNPLYKTDQLIQQYMSLPDGSPQKIAAGRSLYPVFSGGMVPPVNSGRANQTGATSPMPGANMPMTGVTPGLGAPGFVKDPRFGSSRSGAGGTYTDPQTGQMVSTDTAANTTQDQKTIAAAQRVVPLINDIANKQAPFMTVAGRAGLLSDKVQNLLGANKQSPSDYASVQANTELAAESLIKAYGLNVTDQSADMMKTAVKPIAGESPQSYKQRLQNTLATIAQNQSEAEARLSGGNQIGQTNSSPSSTLDNLAPLLQGKNPAHWDAQQQAQQQQPQQIQLPTFKNKEEGVAWFNSQPPEVQAQIRAHLGSKK